VVFKHKKDNLLVISVETSSNTSIIHVMEYIQGHFSRDFAKVFHDSSYNSNEIIINYLQQNIEIFFGKKIEVITEFNVKNIETLLLFEKKSNISFKFTVPKQGIKLEFLELCKKNAKFKLDGVVNSETNIKENLNEIEKIFCVGKKVNRIECIDISHTSGAY
jgi:excinuclease UvrABC nuclease subunit